MPHTVCTYEGGGADSDELCTVTVACVLVLAWVTVRSYPCGLWGAPGAGGTGVPVALTHARVVVALRVSLWRAPAVF